MTRLIALLLLLPFISTAQTKTPGKELPALKAIFDRNGLKGTIILSDRKSGLNRGYNTACWDSGYLPASTFKIVNSLIGLETGVIDTSYIFKWNGEKRRLPDWNRDLSLRDAFRVSCVPCYQELARKIGTDRMRTWLDTLKYGHMVFDEKTLDLFWLEGESRITPAQQMDFVRRLYEEKLPLKHTTMQDVKGIMLNEKTESYTLSGKTGWAVRNGNNYGWFVGFLETKENTWFVATQVQPKDNRHVDDFAAARKLITMEVFRSLGIIP
jgi:beta-lactamase class D OXA-209